MANVDWMAFRPVSHRDGSPYNGSFTKCYAGEDLFMGDLVELGATGTASGDGAYAQVGRAETGDLIRGIVVGWEFAPGTLEDKYCRSGNVVYVADTSSLILEGQTVAAGLNAAAVGLNVDFVVTAAGDTTTGESGYEINDATEAPTATLDLKIVGLVDRPDNDITAANMKVLVMTNKNWNTDQVVGV